MRARMPYLQRWKGKWRVRKPIPKSVQAVLGRGQYLTRGLHTADRTEADRLSIPIIAEFDEMIRLAEIPTRFPGPTRRPVSRSIRFPGLSALTGFRRRRPRARGGCEGAAPAGCPAAGRAARK